MPVPGSDGSGGVDHHEDGIRLTEGLAGDRVEALPEDGAWAVQARRVHQHRLGIRNRRRRRFGDDPPDARRGSYRVGVEVIATFSPTSELTRVDLPTLGRPTTATNPDLTKPCQARDGLRRRVAAPAPVQPVVPGPEAG